MLFGEIEGIVSGLLAFFGAIIGGGLTLVGVWLTLENQRKRDERERFLNSYNVKMSTVTEIKKKIDYLVGVEIQMLDFKDNFFPNYKQKIQSLRREYIERFILIMDNELKNIELNLDFDLYNNIEKRYRSIQIYKYYASQYEIGLMTQESFEEHTKRMYYLAKEIYTRIDNYRSELMKKYCELK